MWCAGKNIKSPSRAGFKSRAGNLRALLLCPPGSQTPHPLWEHSCGARLEFKRPLWGSASSAVKHDPQVNGCENELRWGISKGLALYLIHSESSKTVVQTHTRNKHRGRGPWACQPGRLRQDEGIQNLGQCVPSGSEHGVKLLLILLRLLDTFSYSQGGHTCWPQVSHHSPLASVDQHLHFKIF